MFGLNEQNNKWVKCLVYIAHTTVQAKEIVVFSFSASKSCGVLVFWPKQKLKQFARQLRFPGTDHSVHAMIVFFCSFFLFILLCIFLSLKTFFFFIPLRVLSTERHDSKTWFWVGAWIGEQKKLYICICKPTTYVCHRLGEMNEKCSSYKRLIHRKHLKRPNGVLLNLLSLFIGDSF